MEKDTLSQYPLQIQSTGIDVTSMLSVDGNIGNNDKKVGQINVIQMVTNMFSKMDSNDLESLKQYLDSGESGIEPVSYTHLDVYKRQAPNCNDNLPNISK